MSKRITLTASLLLLATTFCHARTLTLEEADTIIVILIVFVILLIVLGGASLYHNRIVDRRNEQLLRILHALDDYRAIVGDGELSLDEQEKMVIKKQPKAAAKMVQLDEGQAFFVKMDARVTKEKPFTDPDFDQHALIEFMGVNRETFCKLVPRYTDPERTLDYINSRRAEYAAKILMEHSDDGRHCRQVWLHEHVSSHQWLQIRLWRHANGLYEQHEPDVQEERNLTEC